VLETLLEVQLILAKEMPEAGTPLREAIDKIDGLIDELQSES
jgi:hypothetical protein